MNYIDRASMEDIPVVGKIGGFRAIVQALLDRDFKRFSEIEYDMRGEWMNNFARSIVEHHADFFSFPEGMQHAPGHDFMSANEFATRLKNYEQNCGEALTPYAIKSILDLYTIDALISDEILPITALREFKYSGKILGLSTPNSQIVGSTNNIFTLLSAEEPPYNGLILWVYCTKGGMVILRNEQYSLVNSGVSQNLAGCNIVYQIDIGEKIESFDDNYLFD